MRISRDTLLLWSVAGYLFLFPYYIFESGQPQVSDFMILSSVVYASGLIIRSIRSQSIAAGSLLAFIFWTLMVNGYYEATSPYGGFIKYSLYYVFNAYLFFATYAVLSLRRDDKASEFLQKAVIIALCLQLPLALTIPNDGFREIGTFNNPNQLGYFAVTAVAVVVALNSHRPINKMVFISLVPASFLVAMTFSKAAIASLVVMLAMFALHSITRVRTIVIFALVVGAIYYYVQKTGYAELVIDRFSNLSIGGDDSAAGRGYDRLVLNMEYLILGAGEGAYKVGRFESMLQNEMHSTFGNMLFAYGITGFSLFLFFLYRCLSRSTLIVNIAFFSGPFLYGITHNGIRSGLLWVLLAAMIAAKTRTPVPGDNNWR